MPPIEANEARMVTELVRSLCGVELGPTKGYLIESRLASLLSEYGLDGYEALCHRARQIAEHSLRTAIVDRITTHETLFFRDKTTFDALQYKVLPAIFDEKASAGSRHLRVWSAACSTGQEPYSVAMILLELLGPSANSWNIEIVATDISEPAVQKASSGRFQSHELTRSSIQGLVERYSDACDDGRQMRKALRDLCRFQVLDLQRDFSLLGSFDLILCRNVLIYFDAALRKDILYRIAQRLLPTGRFFVGSTENLLDCSNLFSREEHCGASVHRLASLGATPR